MPSALAELEQYVDSLSKPELAELDKMLAPELRALWLPDPENEPQTKAYYSDADLMLFGGSPGGGKSDLLVGLALTQHHRSVIFRSQSVDLRGLEERIITIAGRDGWNGADKILRRNGKILELGHLAKPGAELSWQGRAHDLICVGRGTPVLMADGSYRAIETLTVGNLVETLEGPRAIERAFPAQYKNAVEVTTRFGSQIQSDRHELLTPEGWVCHGKFASVRPSATSSSSVSHIWSIAAQSSLSTCGRLVYNRSRSILGRLHTFGRYLFLLGSGRSFGLETYAGAASGRVESDFEGFVCQPRDETRLPLLNAQLGRRLRAVQLVWPNALHYASLCGGSDEQKRSLLLNYLGHCLVGPHPCDEQPRQCLDPCSVPEAGQLYLHRLADVEQQSPSGSGADGREQTPKRSDRIESYGHPYTKERRQIQARAELASESFKVRSIGVSELYDLQISDVNHYITKHGFVNRNCFDEGAQLAKAKVSFVMGWLRSVIPGQRRRVVIASNPPTGGEGEWLCEWFAPWVDAKYLNPAQPGELRWAVTAPDKDATTVWVKDGAPVFFETDREYRPATKEEVDTEHPRVCQPLTRTFIPSMLKDNPYLAKSGYRAQLQALPEPLRSQLLNGDFMAGRADHEWQVIPTQWVKEAQARWTPKPPDQAAMSAIGVDVAQGGMDNSVLAPRHGPWYAMPISRPGVETPNPSDVAGMVVTHRRNGAVVVIDMGGGYGGGVKERLTENDIEITPYNGAHESKAKTKDGQLSFVNKRAEAHWRFREALDPDQDEGSPIALPPDPQILADLTAPRWKLMSRGIQIESKEELKKPERLGRSPDKGDAIVMAWSEGEKALVRKMKKRNRPESTSVRTDYAPGTGWMNN